MSNGWGIAISGNDEFSGEIGRMRDRLRHDAYAIRHRSLATAPAVQDGLAEIADEIEMLAARLMSLDADERAHDTAAEAVAARNDARMSGEEIDALFQQAAE